MRAQKVSTREEWSQRISEALGGSTASLDYRLSAIARGYALMRAAHLDFTPAIGRNATRREPSQLDVLRGIQPVRRLCADRQTVLARR